MFNSLITVKKLKFNPLYFLILFVCVDSSIVVGKTCEKKWAEYYSGKRWFKPSCDTEKYKRRQEALKELYRDDDGRQFKKPKYQTKADNLVISNYRYSQSLQCDSSNYCMNIYATITNNNKDGVEEALFRCEYAYTLSSGQQHTNRITFLASTLYDSDSFFSDGGIKPGRSQDLLLYEGKAIFYNNRTRIRKANHKAKYTVKLPQNSNSTITLNSVSCKPIRAH